MKCSIDLTIINLIFVILYGSGACSTSEIVPGENEEKPYCLYGGEKGDQKVFCNKNNSRLMNNFNLEDKDLQSDRYGCLDVTLGGEQLNTRYIQCAPYIEDLCEKMGAEKTNKLKACKIELAYPMYCFYGTDACNEKNSKLPAELDLGVTKFRDYTCVNVTYQDTSKKNQTSHQCAPRYEKDICSTLKNKHKEIVYDCVPEMPRSNSDIFCPKGSENVACTKDNSKIPDLKIKEKLLDEYICLDLTYKKGWLKKEVVHIEQCALQTANVDLCDVLKKMKQVVTCSSSVPVITGTNPEPTDKPSGAQVISLSIPVTFLTIFSYVSLVYYK